MSENKNTNLQRIKEWAKRGLPYIIDALKISLSFLLCFALAAGKAYATPPSPPRKEKPVAYVLDQLDTKNSTAPTQESTKRQISPSAAPEGEKKMRQSEAENNVPGDSVSPANINPTRGQSRRPGWLNFDSGPSSPSGSGSALPVRLGVRSGFTPFSTKNFISTFSTNTFTPQEWIYFTKKVTALENAKLNDPKFPDGAFHYLNATSRLAQSSVLNTFSTRDWLYAMDLVNNLEKAKLNDPKFPEGAVEYLKSETDLEELSNIKRFSVEDWINVMEQVSELKKANSFSNKDN